MKILKKKHGFTLIEIIVVIVILAVLMAVAVPSVMSYMKEGEDTKYVAVARAYLVRLQANNAKFYNIMNGGFKIKGAPQPSLGDYEYISVSKFMKNGSLDEAKLKGWGVPFYTMAEINDQQTDDALKTNNVLHFKKNAPNYKSGNLTDFKSFNFDDTRYIVLHFGKNDPSKKIITRSTVTKVAIIEVNGKIKIYDANADNNGKFNNDEIPAYAR